jgi:DNA-binding MarR family transcriptional regulator
MIEMERHLQLARVGTALRRMLHSVESARLNAAREHQLHPTDFACIGLLARSAEPLSPKDIISQLELTSGSVTALLDRLERAGFITRMANPDDRRSLLVMLNRQSAREAMESYEKLEQSYRNATAGFGAEDLTLISEFLERMVELAEGIPT